MNHPLCLLIVPSLLYFIDAAELNERGQLCESKLIMIPSGRTTSSDLIRINGASLGRIYENVIHEKCKGFVESERRRRLRARRSLFSKTRASSAGKKMRTVAEKARARGKGFLKTNKQPEVVKEARFEYWDKMIRTFELANDGLRTGKEIYDTYQQFQSVEQDEFEEDERWMAARKAEMFKEKQIGEDVEALLEQKKAKGFILNHPDVQNSIENEAPLEVTTVKCIREGFTGRFALQFRMLFTLNVEKEARKCNDEGSRQEGDIEYRELPDRYMVLRNNHQFIVDGSKCTMDKKNVWTCPESSLTLSECSVSSVDHCGQGWPETESSSRDETEESPNGILSL